jgi:choline dehydrogenase-like flavoprotein
MTDRTRREFLKRTGRAGLAVCLGTPLLDACYGEDVYEPTGDYDAIIVGAGAAGIIVATKLQLASGGRKRILLIEADGPTTAKTGGKAYPPWLPAGRTDITMFDVPGEYSQLAWTPFGTPYQRAETSWTYQGIGIGGNTVYNGMLFQTNPPAVFDRHWPP